MNNMTTDEMIAYLEKAMKEKHHPDWLGWVGQNKVFKYKTIPIDSVSPADGWEGDQNKIDNMAKSDLNNAPLIVVHKDGTMIDGNHRHQALKKQGAQTVQAYIGEVNENKDKITGNEMRKLLDLKHSHDDGIHVPTMINDVRRHAWALIDNYPLAKLGSVEDPYNRITDTDDDYAIANADLSDPIVIAPDRKSVIDGNHRVQKARNMGKTHLPAYFPMIDENKLNFQLVNTEDLSEARIFRTTNNFKMLKGKDVADLLYLTTLSIYLMYKDDKQYDYARSYAKQTVQYGPYTLFRSHATDLYMLAHVCNSNHRENFNFRNNSESQKFLMSTSFANRTHWNVLNKLKSGQLNDTEAHPYLFRLERQLKVNDGRYKQWRRLIMDWENLRYRQRQFVTANILQEYRRRARGTEMIGPLSTMVKYKKYGVSDKFSKKPTNNKGTNLQKFAGTVGGAVAGRYAGKKIAQKTGANVDKYKKVGTGLGAIAGYWAGGRKRQK